MLILTFLEPTKKCGFFLFVFVLGMCFLFLLTTQASLKKKIHKVIHVWLNLKTSLLTLQMNTASSAQQNLRENTAPSFILSKHSNPPGRHIQVNLSNELYPWSWLPHPQESGFFPQSFGLSGSFLQEITFSSAAEWAPWLPWLLPPKTKQESV